jgi:hypothetical protein
MSKRRPLITPAFFSHRTPPDREKREKDKRRSGFSPLSPGGWERGGREEVGGVRSAPKGRCS